VDRFAGVRTTDLAVIDVAEGALVLRELAPGVSVDDVVARTAAPLVVNLSTP